MVLSPQARLFPPFQRAAPPTGIKSPPPPFPKAVEWLDSSKPCWQSRSLFRAIVWPRRRSRPSRGTAPLRVYFGCSDWSACVCVHVVSLGYRQPGRRGSVPCVHTSLFIPRSAPPWISPRVSLSMAVCVRVSLNRRAGPGRTAGTGRSLLCTSTGQASKRHSGQGGWIFTDSDRGCYVKRKGTRAIVPSFPICLPPQDREEQADETRQNRQGMSQVVICSESTTAYLPCPAPLRLPRCRCPPSDRAR